jgi:hypothetical protein
MRVLAATFALVLVWGMLAAMEFGWLDAGPADTMVEVATGGVREKAQFGEPARVAVDLPAVEPGSSLSLVVGLSAYTPSNESNDAAVVRLTVPGKDESVVVGRFSVFPREPFEGQPPKQQMRFSFRLPQDVVRSLGPQASRGFVEVGLVDPQTGKPVNDATLTVNQATIVER